MQCNLVCYNLIIRQTENKLNTNHIHTHSDACLWDRNRISLRETGGEIMKRSLEVKGIIHRM